MKKTKCYLNVLVFIALALSSCNKEEALLQVPEVTTNSVTDIAYQSATCGGFVKSAGIEIITQGICWSTKPTPTIKDSVSDASNEMVGFNIVINSLKPDSTYYIRAYATNNIGTGYGKIIKFKTKRASISVTTALAHTIIQHSAICGGTFSTSNGVTPVLQGVCWSLSPFPTIEDNNTTVVSTNNNFSVAISNLLPNKIYYARAYAGSFYELIYGDNIVFKTRQTALSITAPTLSNITTTTVDYSGTVTSEQPTAITARGVCWSTNSNPTIADNKSSDGVGNGMFAASITGLNASTTYYIRSYVADNEGIIYGDIVSFKTIAIGLPIVNTLSVVKIGPHSATLQGQITKEGNASIIRYGYYCSSSANPMESNSFEWGYNTGTATTFSMNIYSFVLGEKYYIRAFAENSIGIGYGNVIEYVN